MYTLKILIALAMVFIIVGCVPSLHPLFTEKELVFEPVLVGTWLEEKEEDIWTFQKSGHNAYELIYTRDGNPSKFAAHLIRLGKFLFLDIYPKDPEIKTNDFYKIHLIPAHTFLRIWIEKDGLRLAMLSKDWLEKMMTQKKINLPHERLDKLIVLTASTKALQEFVLKYADDSKAFSERGFLHRLTEEEANKLSLQHATETADKEIKHAEMSEDIEIMSRIIDRTLKEKLKGEYYSSLLFGGKGCRGVYLKNYGVSFIVNVQFPVAEIQVIQPQTNEEQGLWQRTELQVRNRAVPDQEVYHYDRQAQFEEQRATVAHYESEKVNQLKEDLVRLIADYAVNIAQLETQDIISFVVFGKGSSDIVTQSNLLLQNQLAGTTVTTTTLIVKVKKSDLDAHKAGKIDLKALLKRAEVVQY
jgi:hypothetical protein